MPLFGTGGMRYLVEEDQKKISSILGCLYPPCRCKAKNKLNCEAVSVEMFFFALFHRADSARVNATGVAIKLLGFDV
jgi:hypothetical protein